MASAQLTIRDAKIDRLLRYKGLSNQDEFSVNYIYEERAYKNFLHNGLSGMLWSGLYFLFFKGNKRVTTKAVFTGFFLLSFAAIKDRNNRVLDEKLNPFFEKYRIK